MKTGKILLALIVCSALLIPQGFAKDVWELASSDLYKEKVGGMFGRGLINAVTSPVDILVQTVDKTKEGPALIGTLTGMAGGLGCTALRAGSGIIDVALFWVPGFNGFPVNRSYHNCLLCSEKKETTTYQAVYQTPIVQQPIIASAPQQSPLVTVVEEQPADPTIEKKVVRDPYRYVKK